jgi:hypothetical protein
VYLRLFYESIHVFSFCQSIVPSVLFYFNKCFSYTYMFLFLKGLFEDEYELDISESRLTLLCSL